MIPPVPPEVFAANPRFEKLHQHLTKNVLDVDASTRSTNATQKAISEQLNAHRSRVAENCILSISLFNLCTSEDLPGELRDLVLVIASYISNASKLSLSADEHRLMKDNAEDFLARVDEVGVALEKDLKVKHDALASIAAAVDDFPATSTTPEPAPRQNTPRSTEEPPDLASQVERLTSTVDKLCTHTLPSSQYDTTNALIALLKAQASHLQHLIRHLEQRKHGAEARHLIARAQFFSAVAQGLEAKCKTTYLEQRRDVYSPELRRKLAERMDELDQEERRMEERRRKLQVALDEYEDVGGDVMRTLGRRYGEIEEEIEGVKRDVDRLKGGRGG